MPTALVIDDDYAIRLLISGALGDEGFDVLAAGTVTEARRVLSERQPDLMILDLMIPDGGAQSLDALVRDVAPAPVLVLSGMTDLHQRAEALGASGALAKPFDLDEFINVVVGMTGSRDAPV